MASSLKPSFILLWKTATDDNPFRLADAECAMLPADVAVYNHDVYLGDAKSQLQIIYAGDWYTPTQTMPVDLSQIWFRNKVAGSNTTVVVTGIAIPG